MQLYPLLTVYFFTPNFGKEARAKLPGIGNCFWAGLVLQLQEETPGPRYYTVHPSFLLLNEQLREHRSRLDSMMTAMQGNLEWHI